MTRTHQDLVGKKFGRWNVISDWQPSPSSWHCRCDCGEERRVTAAALKSGQTKSCGCLKSTLSSIQARKRGHRMSKRTFGASLDRFFDTD